MDSSSSSVLWTPPTHAPLRRQSECVDVSRHVGEPRRNSDSSRVNLDIRVKSKPKQARWHWCWKCVLTGCFPWWSASLELPPSPSLALLYTHMHTRNMPKSVFSRLRSSSAHSEDSSGALQEPSWTKGLFTAAEPSPLARSLCLWRANIFFNLFSFVNFVLLKWNAYSNQFNKGKLVA